LRYYKLITAKFCRNPAPGNYDTLAFTGVGYKVIPDIRLPDSYRPNRYPGQLLLSHSE